MSKIITLIIEFLNRINKFIWKIIISLSRFTKVEDITIDNKPTDERYKHFKVDEPPIIEPFVKLEHKDYKQLIKDNNIKPIKRRKDITVDIKCPYCGAPKEYLYDNNGKQTQFECKACSYFLIILTNKMMLSLGVHIVGIPYLLNTKELILMFIFAEILNVNIT